jgi:hypothetical protein
MIVTKIRCEYKTGRSKMIARKSMRGVSNLGAIWCGREERGDVDRRGTALQGQVSKTSNDI